MAVQQGWRRRRHQRKRFGPWLSWRKIVSAALSALLLTGSAGLVHYAMQASSAWKTDETLRQAASFSEVSENPLPSPVPLAATPPAATALPAQVNVQAPSVNFDELHHINRDIVAWLTIDSLIDEPVMQRDNVYYLNHDAFGIRNVNGALFLDESADLDNGRGCLIIYGHNMKNGSRFGRLQRYNSAAYRLTRPFITLNTLHGTARYVIFAAGTGIVESANFQALDLVSLLFPADDGKKQTALSALIDQSIFAPGIDVEPNDQLLVLITCTDQESERRFVAARRLRSGETEDGLRAQLTGSGELSAGLK